MQEEGDKKRRDRSDQDAKADEVEGHRLQNAPPQAPGRLANRSDEDAEDEVEAHRLQNAPPQEFG